MTRSVFGKISFLALRVIVLLGFRWEWKIHLSMAPLTPPVINQEGVNQML